MAAIGWFDYITGPEIAFSLFYLIPVAAASWWMSAIAAWWSVGAATLVWFAADALLYPANHLPISLWNAFTRFVVFAGAVIAIRKVRTARERERADATTTLRLSESRFRSLVES